MAAGSGASGVSLESTLDRKFQAVSNTMDSIQGLSTWCIDNKKCHSLIVRYWMKWLRKSDASHRLNLVYLANDIIQNCKRKNAIVYRTAFAEMLPDAFLLVKNDGNSKVIKSVERILSIWEERHIYTGTLIGELKGYLKEEVKEESPPDTPVEQKTPVDTKAALKSKIVAEFVPAALIEQLSTYKKSVEEVELKEKQLAAMRVDVCSSDALKKLKDKAGGKRFSRDFEEGSAKLQEFVKFLDRESKGGSLLLEALSNADIFYEMQYQEVKIVANAYQTFANRVSHLKRKLDTLKATLPDLDDSPIPSPSADAPSPTGSESPFRGLETCNPDPDLDGSAMDEEAERPAPSPLSSPGGSPPHSFTVGENDNREVEDMELSEDEMESSGIIVVERGKCPAPVNVANATNNQPPSQAEGVSVTSAPPSLAPPPASTANVDLSKIGALLNSLNSVVKATGPVGEGVSAPAAAASSVHSTTPTPVAPKDGSSLVNLLSQVDLTPESILSALSKVQGQGSSMEGLTSLLNSPAGSDSTDSHSKAQPYLPPSSTPASSSSSSSATAPPTGNTLPSLAPVPSPPVAAAKQSRAAQGEVPLQTASAASALVQALHRDMDLAVEPEPPAPSDSLESKIHCFLQGNPGFSAFNLGLGADSTAGGSNHSPVAGTDTRDGTPVRDEGGGTPTQDEVMDKQAGGQFASEMPPAVEPAAQAADSRLSAAAAYQNNAWQTPSHPQQRPHLQPGEPQNGQGYQPYLSGGQELANPGVKAPVAHYQQFPEQGAGLPKGNGSGSQTVGDFQDDNHGAWYGSSYSEASASLNHRSRSMATPGGGEEGPPSGLYRYQADASKEHPGAASLQGPASSSGFYKGSLPPVPILPPPPKGFEPPPVVTGEQRPALSQEMEGIHGAKVDSIISGMVVHDHQHKSIFHHDDPLYDRHDDLYRHPEDLPRPDDSHYQDEPGRYHEDPYNHNILPYEDETFRPPDDPFYRPDDPYYRPASPPRGYPRGRGRPTPPIPAPKGFPFHPHSSSPLHLSQRRPPLPHPEMRHPGPRHSLRPVLHPTHHHPPRGPRHGPPFPPFRGPDPWLRGKRPGPRGGGPGGPGFLPKRPYLPPQY